MGYVNLDKGNKKIKFFNDNHEYFTLNTGDKIPIVQFGTYQMKGEECYEGVASAIKLGYKGLDTASIYDNETQVRIKIFLIFPAFLKSQYLFPIWILIVLIY